MARFGLWLGLLAASAALGAAFVAIRLPAALLLGPMMAAIAFGVAGRLMRVPRPLFQMAQGVLGCLIAGTVTHETLADIAREWDVMALAILANIVVATLIGWLLARFGSLPGSAAAWGSSPGAASAMVIMAAEHGADPRLVALMQYVRVIWVVLAAALVSRFFFGVAALPGDAHHPADAVAAFDLIGFAATLAVAIGGSLLGARFRVPAGGVLVPLLIGAVLNATGAVRLVVPHELLVAAYAILGWYIGLQFERAILFQSVRALPQISLSALGMILLSGGVAWLMTRFSRYDGLTAFLATSPGGIDSVAIIALDGGAETPFVMALQTLRVLVVILVGPSLARMIARTAIRPA